MSVHILSFFLQRCTHNSGAAVAKAFFIQAAADQLGMSIVTRFHLYTQKAAVDAFGIALFVMHTSDIAAALGNNAGHTLQLTRLIQQLDEQAGGAARLEQAAVYHSGQAGKHQYCRRRLR